MPHRAAADEPDDAAHGGDEQRAKVAGEREPRLPRQREPLKGGAPRGGVRLGGGSEIVALIASAARL